MATSFRTRSQAVRQSLHLYIDPSSYTTTKASHTPSSAFTTNMSARNDVDDYYRPDAGTSDSTLFSVLCMYDFSSDDSGLLSFNKNEILDIVKCDDTGWWAAMRKDGPVVGWIPQAYVKQLSDDMAQRLRNVREEFRVYEYEAEQLYNSAPVSRIPALFDTDSATTSPLPEYEENRLSIPAAAAPQSGRREQHLHPHSNSRDSLRPGNGRPMPPPSPTSPMPHPPPLLEKDVKSARPALSTESDANRNHATTLTSKRSIRTRPVILEDNPTLSRLSTLIESKNAREIERIASSDINSSLDILSKHARGGKPPKRQASGNARHMEAIIHIRPWYLQPQLVDQIEEDSKGHIRNATLPALIERLTTHDAPVDLTRRAEFTTFTNVFLMTFRTFTSANVLFEMLTERYNSRPVKTLSDQESIDWKENWQIPTRKRILEIFSIWLEDHRLLEEEPHLAKPLTDFLRTITTPPHNADAEAIIKTLERLTFTVPLDKSAQNTSRKSRKSKAHKNDLMKVDPTDMAEQLTLWEQALYVKVTPQECLAYAKAKTGPTVARLLAFCSTHDNLVSWVKSSILNHEILGKRSYAVDFWIKVAEKCRLLNNIASMSAIIIALSSTVITRLHLTWAHVSRRSNLEALLRHNEPSGGFSGYRTLLQNAEGPCVPFITMYLSDIIHTEENFAYQDTTGRVCFYKRARWYEIINNMLKFTKRTYTIPPNESMKQFIETQLMVTSKHDSNWFWSKSQEVQHSELAHADIRKGLEAAGF